VTAPTPLIAFLDQLDAEGDEQISVLDRAAAVPRLTAAVRAVLELADMVERDALESAEPENPDGAEHVRACALLLVSHSIRAAIGGDGR
jgi:hypothetical protein